LGISEWRPNIESNQKFEIKVKKTFKSVA
jgi:hypothetical protein